MCRYLKTSPIDSRYGGLELGARGVTPWPRFPAGSPVPAVVVVWRQAAVRHPARNPPAARATEAKGEKNTAYAIVIVTLSRVQVLAKKTNNKKTKHCSYTGLW